MPALARTLTNRERTRQAALRARAAGHVPQPMPRQLPPDRIEDAYAHRLRSHVRHAIAAAYAPVLRALPELVTRARVERGDSATWRADASNSGQGASALIRAAEREMKAALREVAKHEARATAGDVNDHNRVQLGAQVKAVLGVNLAGDAALKPIIAGFIHENAKLVTNISTKLAGEIEGAVLAALTTGQRHEDLAVVLRDKFGVAEGRAQLIAVDQVGKLNGQLNVQRSKDLGVTHGWWRSSEDERVRGNPLGKYPKAIPSHYARNGLYFAISDPPKGKDGTPEMPGIPVRCRCRFEADLSAVLGEGPPAGAEGPVQSVEEQEAEAARLLREVEAMLAAQRAPVVDLTELLQRR